MKFWLPITVGLLAGSTVRNQRHLRIPKQPATEAEPPTVSLLIPARNETHAVTRALHNALALDYPKLEIIVLDDQSRDNTSEKVRSFAHDGIRFLKGKPLAEGWVGKNWACTQLAEAASGDYLVFCDIDVLLNSQALTRLIRYMQQVRVSCVSALPQLLLERRAGAAFTHLLPWWMLVLPVGFLRVRPAYGGLMLYTAEAYRQHGGYSRYPDAILAEFRIAQDFAKRDHYRFFANYGLDMALLKKASSLNEARLRYLLPLYQLSPIAALMHLALALLPLVSLFASLWLYLIIASLYALTMKRHLNYWLLATLLLPLLCLVELTTLLLSLWRHARGHITWKQRSV